MAKGVRNQSLCPAYSTMKMGSVMYAARKSETLNLPGQKIWKPLVMVKSETMKSTTYVAYGWNGVR